MLIQPQERQHETIVVRDRRRIHHARDVLRLSPGDHIACFDGAGWQGQGRIVQCTPQALEIVIDQERVETTAGTLAVAASLIKPERFEWLLEKVTELGATACLPFVSARTVVRPKPEAAMRQQQRWQRLLEAAAQQCGRATVPQLQPLLSFEQLLKQFGAYDHVVLPTLACKERMPLQEALAPTRSGQKLLLLIGPEGDFTAAEARRAQEQGARAVSLGPLTLRAETAAVACVAAVRYHLGELR